MVLKNVFQALQVHAVAANGTAGGGLSAPQFPPEGIAEFPFTAVYPRTGTILGEASEARRDLVDIYFEYHLARQNLPVDVETALNFFENFPNRLIADPTLGGTVSTIVMDRDTGGIRWEFGEMSYMSLKTIGYRFTITVKLRRLVPTL